MLWTSELTHPGLLEPLLRRGKHLFHAALVVHERLRASRDDRARARRQRALQPLHRRVRHQLVGTKSGRMKQSRLIRIGVLFSDRTCNGKTNKTQNKKKTIAVGTLSKKKADQNRMMPSRYRICIYEYETLWCTKIPTHKNDTKVRVEVRQEMRCCIILYIHICTCNPTKAASSSTSCE